MLVRWDTAVTVAAIGFAALLLFLWSDVVSCARGCLP